MTNRGEFNRIHVGNVMPSLLVFSLRSVAQYTKEIEKNELIELTYLCEVFRFFLNEITFLAPDFFSFAFMLFSFVSTLRQCVYLDCNQCKNNN